MPEYKPFNQLGTTSIKVPMYMKTECIHPYPTFLYRGVLYLPAADTLLQHKIKIVFLKFSEFPLGNGNNMPFYFDVPRLSIKEILSISSICKPPPEVLKTILVSRSVFIFSKARPRAMSSSFSFIGFIR